ncbi:PadR family transcriptional regulator [Crossiella sp. CA-258035]|uniref:PadR family transcriptional regulator n=1 Tax=Crossiella sp. CA-258035 TaxID=2981138 RepID=UPI0024BC56C3|nr:PadR family transcriptional regulator [Crossiella sp. CA-258035]WHT18772.1 PadR family transcriptional regulator [Crossiella sp. CA-258035]
MSATTRLAVLGAVRMLQPVNYYQVRRNLLTWNIDRWANLQPGSIFHALKSMHRDGLLTAEESAGEGNARQKLIYTVTPAGEAEYKDLLRSAWLREEHSLDGLMTAICLLPDLSAEELIPLVKHRIVRIEADLMRTGSGREAVRAPGKPRHIVELFDLSGELGNAELTWCRNLLAKLEGGEYQGWQVAE